MKRHMLGLLALCSSVGIGNGLSGCGLIMDTAVNQASDQAGQAVANKIAADLTAPMYRAYALGLMGAYFWAGGYWLAWHPYNPGDWTKWKHEIQEAKKDDQGPKEPLFVEKAFLRRNPDGSEWWRLKAFQQNPEDTVIFESLFSSDHTKLVRVRGKIGPNPVQEIQYAEGEANFPPPQAIEDPAIKKAKLGTVELSSGTMRWSADHARFTAHDGSGQFDVYFSTNVPGGVVKYEFVNKEADRYTIQLVGNGGGAMSELGSY